MFKDKHTRARLSIGLLLIVGLAACASPAAAPQEPTPVGTEVATLESVETTVTLPATSANFQEQVINAWYARDAQAFASFYTAPVTLMSAQAPLLNLDSADKLVELMDRLIPNAPAGTPAAITDPDEILALVGFDASRLVPDGEFALVGADEQGEWVILVFVPADQLDSILLVNMDYQEPQTGPSDPAGTFQEQVINAWYARDLQAFASFYTAPVMLMGPSSPLDNLDSVEKLFEAASRLIPDAPAGTPATVTNPDDILTQINYDPRQALADGEFALVGADSQAQNWVVLVFKPTDQLFGILLVPMN